MLPWGRPQVPQYLSASSAAQYWQYGMAQASLGSRHSGGKERMARATERKGRQRGRGEAEWEGTTHRRSPSSLPPPPAAPPMGDALRAFFCPCHPAARPLSPLGGAQTAPPAAAIRLRQCMAKHEYLSEHIMYKFQLYHNHCHPFSTHAGL